MGILGGLAGGLGKGLLGKAGGGLLKGGGGLLKGGGGLLKGGGPLKGGGGGGGGLLQKAFEGIGGAQGILDLVGQFMNGGGAQEAGGAEGAGEARGGQGCDPLTKMIEKFAAAKNPEDVDTLVKKLLEKLEQKGQANPDLNQIVEMIANAVKQQLGAAAGA